MRKLSKILTVSSCKVPQLVSGKGRTQTGLISESGSLTTALDLDVPSMDARKLSTSPGLGCLSIKGGGDFPGGAVVEDPPANAGDMGSNPGLGRCHMPRSN